MSALDKASAPSIIFNYRLIASIDWFPLYYTDEILKYLSNVTQ